MQHQTTRRNFLKSSGAIGAGIALTGIGANGLSAARASVGAPNAKKLDWTLAVAAYSFNKLSFFETVEKTKALGLDCIEGFAWQKLSKSHGKTKFDCHMLANDRRDTRKQLADNGVALKLCYLQTPKKLDEYKKQFDWGKDMGIETFVHEPKFEAYDLLEKLADEYSINQAIHNHPAPSRYYDPKTVLKQCKGRSKRIGACCDTGHWVRSGFKPVDALKLLEGRIISFHLKDVDQIGVKSAPCVPWGTGKGDIADILKEMKRQGFKGVFSIEYEPYRATNYPKIVQCIQYFNKIAGELS